MSPLYGFFNTLGHLLKIAAFILLYQAIIVTGLRRPYRTLFRELHRSRLQLEQFNAELESRVAAQTAEIRIANEMLEQRVAERTAPYPGSLSRIQPLVLTSSPPSGCRRQSLSC